MSKSLKKERVAVEVKRINRRSCKFRIVPDSVCLIKSGTIVTERPEAKIIDENGKEIVPIGKYLWTTETIDPYHLVTDMF